MAAQVGSLYSSLTLESASFVAGLKQAVDKTSSAAAAIEKSLNTIKGAAVGVISGLAVAQVVELGKRALEYASSLDEVSQQLGVTARDLQVYRYAASQVGISNEQIDTSLQKFTNTLGEARAGNTAAIGAFTQLGLSMADIRKGDPHDVLLKAADGIAQIKDRATRAAPEIALFGKTGQQLDTLFSQGSRGVNGLAETAEKLGLVLSHSQIENADKAADKLTELKQVLEVSIARVVADNAQSIYDFADAVEHLIVKAADFAHDIESDLSGLGTLFVDFAETGEQALAGLGGHVDGLSLKITSFHDQMVSLLQGLDQFRNIPLDVTNWIADRFRKNTGIALPASVVGTAGVERSNLAGKYDRAYKDAQLDRGLSALDANTGFGTTKGAGGKGYTDPSAAAARAAKADAAAKKAEAARQKALRTEETSQQEIERATDETLSLRQQLATDAREQANLQHQQTDLDAKAAGRKIDLDVAEGQITAAAGEELHRRLAINTDLQHAEINRELDAKLDQQALDAKTSEIGNRRDLLQAQAALADTAAERRDLELKLLDLQFDEERAREESVIASKSASDAEKDIARARLAALPHLQALGAESVRQRNAGPLGQYQQQLHAAVGDMNETLEGVEVDGLKGLEDGLTGLVSGTETVSAAFKKMAQSIIADLARIAIEKAIIEPLVGSLFGGATLGSGDIAAGLASKATAGITAAPVPSLHFATGGGFEVGGAGGADSKLFSMALSPGEAVNVTKGNDKRRGGTMINQTIRFAGAVDLATRAELPAWFNATKAATMDAIRQDRRRAG